MKLKKLKIRALDPSENRDKAALLYCFQILVLICASVCVGILSLALGIGSFGMPMFLSYFKIPLLVILNIAPIVFLTLLCYAFIGSAWISFLLPSLIVFAGSFTNYFKLIFRDDPLYFEDIKLITESVNITRNYNLYFAPRLAFMLLCILLGTAVIYFMCPGRLRGFKVRTACAVLLVALGTWLFPKYYLSDSVYLKTANNDLINIWSDTQRYVSRGFVYPFFNSITKMRDPAPDGYSKDSAKALLAQYSDDDIPEDKKANVIGVMLEAFCDLSSFDTLEINPDVYEIWHELEENSYSGQLLTNIFAGGTIDTERCFITGFSSLGSFRTQSWSYARYFKEQGYRVEGMHPGYEWFYNRLNVNQNLGFDDYFFTENYFQSIYDNNVAPDNVLFPEIVKRYEMYKDEAPYFNFSVSYQNHGPYETGRLYYGDGHILNDDISQDSRDILNNYLGGVKDTQKELKKMLDTLDEDDEPIFVVIFGDHKPWLGDDNSVYKELGMDILGDSDEAFVNYYSTPYIIWANKAAKEQFDSDFKGEGELISPCYLMNELFDLVGWDGPSYCKMTGELKKTLPVVHTSGRFMEDGALVSEISKEAQEMLSDNKKAMYYLRKDSK